MISDTAHFIYNPSTNPSTDVVLPSPRLVLRFGTEGRDRAGSSSQPQAAEAALTGCETKLIPTVPN